MRITTFLLSGLTALLAATFAQAQVNPVANTGCQDGSAVGGPITSVGGQAPVAGTLTFALEHACPATSNAAFFIWGSCASTLIDWSLSDPCFGSWASPPATCGNGIQNLYLLDGGLTNGTGVVTFAFPIPDLRAAGVDLAAISTTAPGLCFQFICVEIGAANPCRGVSEAVSLTITNP